MKFSAERLEKQKGDFLFFGILILLVGFGLAVMFSASHYYGRIKFEDPFYFLKRQVSLVALGAGISFLLTRVPLSAVRKGIPVLLVFSLLLTAFTFVPGVGRTTLGAKRWIYVFGYSFQPSELVKLTVILYLAHIFSKKEDRMDEFFTVNTAAATRLFDLRASRILAERLFYRVFYLFSHSCDVLHREGTACLFYLHSNHRTASRRNPFVYKGTPGAEDNCISEPPAGP